MQIYLQDQRPDHSCASYVIEQSRQNFGCIISGVVEWEESEPRKWVYEEGDSSKQAQAAERGPRSYIDQLDGPLRASIFGNVGTIVSFRLGARAVEYLAREFYPAFTEEDLVNLPQHHIALELMIDGVSQSVFSAQTFLR
jgi:hypothetical protein